MRSSSLALIAMLAVAAMLPGAAPAQGYVYPARGQSSQQQKECTRTSAQEAGIPSFIRVSVGERRLSTPRWCADLAHRRCPARERPAADSGHAERAGVGAVIDESTGRMSRRPANRTASS
jgi:hypothetical protein